MTFQTTSPIQTGSMASNLGRESQVGTYRAGDPVSLVHKAFPQYSRSTVGQMLKPAAPDCPVMKLAEIVAALCAGGRGDVAERLLLPLDIVRRHARPTFTVDLVADAQKADLMEDLAESEYLAFPSVESKRRWLTKLEAAHIKQAEQIAALRAELAA